MMNYKDDIYFNANNTGDFFRDCIEHAVSFTFDQMYDSSWRRVVSDKPLKWLFENLDKITHHSLIVCHHVMEEQNERWGSEKHLELNIEIRGERTTYIFTAEINFCYLEYFVTSYELNHDLP